MEQNTIKRSPLAEVERAVLAEGQEWMRRRLEQRLAEVRLSNRGLGTSAAQFQSFRHQGRRYGHILDPRTGQPAELLGQRQLDLEGQGGGLGF